MGAQIGNDIENITFLATIAHYATTHQEPDKPILEKPNLIENTVLKSVQLPCRLIPYPQNGNFRGRTKELDMIDTFLNPAKNGGSLSSTTFVIHGMGGVGKSEVALEYVYRSFNHFDAILWITAETQDQVNSGFLSIAQNLGLVDSMANIDHDFCKETVLRWLQITGEFHTSVYFVPLLLWLGT
jgi:hypothetical protein